MERIEVGLVEPSSVNRKEKIMRAAAYVRVSSESQVDNWSIPAQSRETEEYCRQRGWKIVRVYSEEGISAHSDSISKRPEFRRLLQDCNRGEFDVVVVHSLDRWSRNLGVTLESFKQLADRRVAFVSITENIDYSTPEGKLFIAMLGAFAQYFSDSLSKHTRKGMKRRAISGLHNGDVPFGYERCNENCPSEHKGKVHIVPKEAEAVKKLFEYYAAGNWSLSRLAAWLNEQGFRTKNKHKFQRPYGEITSGPRLFTGYSVSGILHNPFFTGKIAYKGEAHPGAHEAIISEELFNAVQEKLKNAKSRSMTVSASYRAYMLKGIARCVYCGYPMWSETSKSGYSYYRGQRSPHSDTKCPAEGKAIRCDVIDSQIDTIMKSLVLKPSWKDKVIAEISTHSEQEQIAKEKKQVEEKLRRLAKAYVDGLIKESEYNLQRKLLRDRLESLVIPKVDATLEAGELIENLALLWEKATIEEKHELLTAMLDAVYIDLWATRSVVGIQPKPPFYPLFQSLNQDENSKVIIFDPSQLEKETAPDSETQSGDISVWWRRGRVELPVQKKVARIFYKLSQPLLSHLAFIC